MSTKDYDFKIGAPVLAAEGEVGRLKYVVMDTDAQVVTHLIVERGRLLRRDIIVPVGWVERTDAEGIRLNAKLADLEGLPEFREVDFWPPDPATRPVLGHPPVNIRFWISPYSTIPTPRSTSVLHRVGLGMGGGEILIRRGLPVYTADGDRAGTVDHLLVDPARHRVTHLVIHRGHWFSQDEDCIVPLDDVTTASESGICLRRRRDELGQMARYRPTAGDMEIQTQVVRSLETQPETRGRGLRVEVERGLVRLLGEVPEAVAQAAAQLARWIRGVIGVEDRTTRPGEPSFRRSPHNTGAHRCQQQGQHGDADRAGGVGRSARGGGADHAFGTRRGGGDQCPGSAAPRVRGNRSYDVPDNPNAI